MVFPRYMAQTLTRSYLLSRFGHDYTVQEHFKPIGMDLSNLSEFFTHHVEYRMVEQSAPWGLQMLNAGQYDYVSVTGHRILHHHGASHSCRPHWAGHGWALVGHFGLGVHQ